MNRAGRSKQGAQFQFLEDELRNREYEIALLKEIGDAVTSELHLEKVFTLVAERARTLIQADTLLIPILDPECTHYTYRAGAGKNANEIVGETFPLEYGICGWIWRHQCAWWHGALEKLDDIEKTRWEREAGNVIAVPLIGKRHFLGGIAGINKIGGGDFTKRDLDLLTMFASQVSIAIENATLFEESERAKLKAEKYQLELKKLNEELAGANKRLGHMALHDPLTELPNRTLVLERIQQSIHLAKRENKPFAILMMDLNRFKDVNDTLGHDVGDKLLKQVSARVQTLLRDVDTFGRLGGDEFVFIMPGSDAEGAMLIANRLKAVLESPFEIENHDLYVEASFGIAIAPQHGMDVSTLLKRADVAMYAAKQSNNDYFVYDPARDLNSPLRLTRLAELRRAVNENRLEIHYQPKINLASRQVIGVEALARWPHAGGFVPPAEFIPVIEQTGLIRPFTKWILDTALCQLSEWWRSGHAVSMAVNLSPYNLRDPELPGQLSELMQKWEVDGNSLVLELTESAFLHDHGRMLETLTRLQAMGIKLSIDDFGTGYSSLSQLKKLPVREVKIDQSFIRDMISDKDDAMIVHSIVELAHNLGLGVVAEGVETREALHDLLKLGCDMAQGYHLGRPQPVTKSSNSFVIITSEARAIN
jgi:diguanylate cyclase (GGDEF)-like protein